MNSTIFIGLDVHKASVSVGIAEGGRGGEVRHLGTFENRVDVLTKKWFSGWRVVDVV